MSGRTNSRVSVSSFRQFVKCRWVWAGFLTLKGIETMLSPVLYGYTTNWWFFFLFGLCELVLVGLACYCIVSSQLVQERTVTRMLAFVLATGGVARFVEHVKTGQGVDQIVLSLFLLAAMLYVQWTFDSIFTKYLSDVQLVKELKREGKN